MAHRVGIIGGDGIGPEVTAEALKVVRAAGVDLETTDYDLGGRRYLATGDVLPDEMLDELRGLRRDPARRGRHTRGTARRARAGLAPQDAFRARSLREPPAVQVRHQPVQRRRRLPRRAREHRGHLRGRGWFPPARHAQRDRDAGIGQHPARRRALRSLRVRPRARPRPEAPDARAQDQRAHVRRRPLAADVRRRSRPSTATSTPRTTTSTRRASTWWRTRRATT